MIDEGRADFYHRFAFPPYTNLYRIVSFWTRADGVRARKSFTCRVFSGGMCVATIYLFAHLWADSN
jgi:hypothetical protein